MTDQEMTAAITIEPIEPVQITLSNCAVYPVTHPDGIMIRKRMAAVAVGDVIHVLSNIHVHQAVPLGRAHT